jgi:peptidoglycan/xylan/chitin deacetylase (PgdA/CDA1 family)
VNMRAIAKVLAHRSGATRAYHARRNADTLTVVMFHRVLPERDIARVDADPLYTATPEFLTDCVTFLRAYYTIVSLEDVLQAQARKKALPPFAALITFDDGWRDNLDHALPALANTPWTLFAAADALLEPDCWWQEVLLWSLRSGAATAEQLWLAAESADSGKKVDRAEGIYPLLLRYADLPRGKRDQILAPYEETMRRKSGGAPMMLTPGELTTLKNAGVGVGAHGASHLPLPLLKDAAADLLRARDLMNAWLGPSAAHAMSFPHGRYDARVLQAVRELQYRLLFTSDAVLNRCQDGWLDGDVVGRIPVDMKDVADEGGRLAPHKLAAWLFPREIRAPMGAF